MMALLSVLMLVGMWVGMLVLPAVIRLLPEVTANKLMLILLPVVVVLETGLHVLLVVKSLVHVRSLRTNIWNEWLGLLVRFGHERFGIYIPLVVGLRHLVCLAQHLHLVGLARVWEFLPLDDDTLVLADFLKQFGFELVGPRRLDDVHRQVHEHLLVVLLEHRVLVIGIIGLELVRTLQLYSGIKREVVSIILPLLLRGQLYFELLDF